MAVAFDTIGGGTAWTSGSGVKTFNGTHALGADVFLVVNTSGNITFSSVTYNGVSMGAAIASPSHANNSANGFVYVYRAVGAGTGSSAAFSMTASGTTRGQAQSISYTGLGVGAVATAVTRTGTGTALAALSVSLSAGQAAFGIVTYGSGIGVGPLSSPTGGTNRYLVNDAANASGFALSDSTSSGVVFGGTSVNAATPWATVTIVLSPISYIGAIDGGTSVTVPTHAVGDLIIIVAWNISATIPTMGAGYTSLGTAVNGTAASGRVAYRIATATNDSSGTWSDCISIWCVVYRGTGTPSAAVSNTGTSTTIGYPALTLAQPGASWVVRPGAHLAATNLNSAALTGYTNRFPLSSGITIFDSNGPVASAAAGTQTVNASNAWIAFSVEVPPAFTATANTTNFFYGLGG